MYPDGGADIYCDADSERLDGIMFNHAGGETFFNALVELAQRVDGCVLWPDDPPCLAVFDPKLVPLLNPEMVEAIGPGILVRTGAELERLIYDGIMPEGGDSTG